MSEFGAVAAMAVAFAGAADAAQRCTPPGGDVDSPITASRQTSAGAETTEYFDKGRYRVTRCDDDGVLLRSQTVFEATAPDGETVRLLSADYRREGATIAGRIPTYAALTTKIGAELYEKHGDDWRDPVLAPTDEGKVDEARLPQAMAVPSNCTNLAWNLSGYTWAADYTSVQFNLANQYDPGSDMRNSLRRGYEAWNFTRNPCGYSDERNFDFIQGPDTPAVSAVPDGINTVDIRSLSGSQFGPCNGAIGCMFPFGTTTHITSFDIRLRGDSDVCLWGTATGATNVPGGCFDIQGVAAHEFGHALGVAHNHNFGDTLYEFVYPSNCEFFSCADYAIMPRDLALGDMGARRSMYPDH